MKLLALFESVTVPPFSVTLPSSTNSVKLPEEFSCSVPNCEYVPPSKSKTALLSILKVPPAELLIVPPRTLVPVAISIVPVALLVSVLPP